jgi:hypothetical protein
VEEHAAIFHFEAVGTLEVGSGDGLFCIFEMRDVDIGEEFQFVLRWISEFFLEFSVFFWDGFHLLFDLSTAMLLDLDFIVDLLVLMLKESDFLKKRAFLIFSCFLFLCDGGLDGSDFTLGCRSDLF